MDQSTKQEIVMIIRSETACFATREEMRQIFGVFEERINEKFKRVMEAFDTIFRQLQRHDERLGNIEKKLEKKADVEEVDALDRRVASLERKNDIRL